MPRRSSSAATILTRAYRRQLKAMTRAAAQTGQRLTRQVRQATQQHLKPPPGPGDWLAGMALGPAGARRYHLYRPPGMGRPGERPPLMVMLHGCGQTGRDFAIGTRMNRLAAREGFLVLYPEQDRMANAQGCWNWFDARAGRATAEAATVLAAIDQVCLLYGADRDRVAIAGLSAGAGMAALVGCEYPQRVAAVAMHSGVGPGAAHSSATGLAAMRGRRAPHLRAGHLPPLLVLQGDADTVVAPACGDAIARAWAAALDALPQPVQLRQRGQRLPADLVEYRRAGMTRVQLVRIRGLGHAWSGGATRGSYTDPKGPDASAMVWAFAARAFRVAAGHPADGLPG